MRPRLVECSLEDALIAERGGEVEERASWGGDGYATNLSDVARLGPGRSVQAHTGRTAPVGSGAEHVDRTGSGDEEIPEDGGTAMAQQRAGAAGQHGGVGDRLWSERKVTHRVDARVEAMQPPGSPSDSDRLRCQPGGTELPRRYQAVSARRHAGDRGVGQGARVTIVRRREAFVASGA